MELKTFLKILYSNVAYIVALSFIGAVIGLTLTKSSQSGFKVQKIYYLQAPSTSQVYSFENFYTQENSRNFTDTAVEIIKSPDFTSTFLQEEEQIAAKKIAPQLIALTTVAQSRQKAQELTSVVEESFNQKISSLESTHSAKLVAINPNTASFSFAPSTKLFTLLGLLSGAVFALFAISLKTYFKL